ncbi:MAG TPA: SHOCT domain-containing protein [Spirochaetota bacterium]|nr:SHOCT domain-containing protein [Spirochaetota bacterium]HNT09655.1 SHOCT domain-containing protein [Spirochaetota bacterium]HNV45395.1 SHOCT domain-containing protein [Spirochaetota bacterium]
MDDMNTPTSDSIIQSHVIFGMTAGAIPLPLVDFVAISAIQIDLIRELAKRHAVDFNANLGTSLVSSLAGTSLAKIGASAVKAIPGVGTALGIGAQVLLAGATTYALGRVFDSHFARGGTLANFNVDAMRRSYDEMVDTGKEFAQSLRKGASKKEDILATIEKLAELRARGAISEDDFETTKKKLLDSLVA